ncbi:MAG: S41 family peptidase, partial [Spirochaetota bacterium]
MRDIEQDSQSTRRQSRRRERVVWGSVGALLIAFLFVLTATPSLFSQEYSETDRAIDVFESVMKFIEQNYVEEVDPDELLDGALRGMFESLDDPYSVYYDEQEMRDLSDVTTGEFGGVGMTITKQVVEDDSDDPAFVEVVSPIEGTPAYGAGVRPGDLIVGIRDAEAEEFQSTEDLTLDQAVNMIRGAPGTSVTLRIRRGARAEFEVTMERDIIEYPTVKYATIPEDIGYLRITNFTPKTVERVQEALDSFEAEGYESMIIDVRSNPGGLLAAVVDIADLFFERGTIVGTAGRSPRENERITATGGTQIPDDLPVVVLIDQGSASASEILAGTLQDRDRAFLIGDTTFGKGSVQQVRQIGEGGFRLTMSKYYLPSGRFIDEVGVDPDLVVEPPELDDEQAAEYAELLTAERIPAWVRENPDPSPGEVEAFVDRLQEDGFDLPDRWIELTIRDEVNRQANVQPVYDLDFDEVLQEAVEMLRN